MFVNLQFKIEGIIKLFYTQMKSKLCKNSFLLLIISIVVYSCSLNNTSSVSISDDATITAFYIAYNDSSTNASTASFTITSGYITDSIYNVDSLPYNTRIDSLIPTIQFASSDGYIINDTLTYTTYSSSVGAIDFTKPVKITNIATDGSTKKEYIVELRVHKIDPYKFEWEKLSDQIADLIFENQKTVIKNDTLFFFTNSGTTNYLYTSLDGHSWQPQPVTGMPTDADMKNIGVFDNTLYLFASSGGLYTSADGKNWSLKTTDEQYTFLSFLSVFQGKLFSVGQHKETNALEIIYSSDGFTWNKSSDLPEHFPVSRFASTTLKPKYGYEKAVIVGGIDKFGNTLNTRWITEDGLYWVNLQNAKYTFSPLFNSAVIYYGSRLLLFGGSSEIGGMVDSDVQLLSSIDAGFSWNTPDSTQIMLPEFPDKYEYRTNVSIVVNPSNQDMYIVGGKDIFSNALSDVWRLKVNYYKFNPSEWYKY